MKKLISLKWTSYFIFLLFAMGSLNGWAQTTELTLEQTLALAEKTSPDLKAVMAREKESQQSSTIAESGFFPTLDLAAVDSGGFPGSSSGLDGFSGLVSSPYRQGAAAGAFSKWDLIDLSVWHDVSAAHYAYHASQQTTRVQRALIDEQVLRVYLEAVRDRGDSEAWQDMAGQLTSIRDTVARFVRNGQYSEVERILIEDQLESANLETEDFNRQYQTALTRLGLLTGLDSKTIACPAPLGLSEDNLSGLQDNGISPLVSRADFEAKAASETTAKFSTENLPKLEVAASAGYLSDARLVNSEDYSVFVGVTVPIFEGFRIDAEEKRAKAEEEAKQNEVSSAQLTLADLNAQYDEQIQTARSDLKTLLPEKETAAKAVVLAKSRYLSFLGPLADLQQALKDKVGVDTQIAEVKTKLLLALGSKLFLNGASLRGAL